MELHEDFRQHGEYITVDCYVTFGNSRGNEKEHCQYQEIY